MDNSRHSRLPAFMPALSLAILLGFEYAAENQYITVDLKMYGLTTAAAFLFPLAVMLIGMKGTEGVTYRFRPFRLRYLTVTVLSAVALSLFCFLLNWISAKTLSGGLVQNAVSGAGAPTWQLLLVSILFPAVCEELFFRGGLLSGLESDGTYAAMIVSALAFAMIHGDLSNIVGPFAAGMVYGYMTYASGSVWTAVIAHCINNAMAFGVNYLLKRYAAVGLWQYFVIIVLFLFLIFLYLAMGRLEKLVERGRVPRIRHIGAAQTVSAIFLSPGLWALVIIFALKTFYLAS